MKDSEQREAAKKFAETWRGRGYEKGDSQPFWISLLRDVFGVENTSEFIKFEEHVHIDLDGFIDAMIPSTKVMIEQKSIDKNLNAPIKQSDGTWLNPFQQARRYITDLPLSKHPRWVVTCNFKEFYVYDMEKPGGDPEIIKLEDLHKEYYRLNFLVDAGNSHLQREMEMSIKAGDIVGLLYDAFYKQYKDPTKESSLKSLNMLCVRLVFCLYAEDAGIFGRKGMFHDYLSAYDARNMRKVLIELFQVLDTKEEDRDPYLDEKLAEFPYVNGGLFADENIEIPNFTDEIRDLLLSKASDDFNWSEISPTIFGAVFESTLNPETRRKGGMHYTSIENIHKVIDPLFLEDLTKELNEIGDIKILRTREKRLKEYQSKLAALKFLDPACGSGNFLTETYISLRRLENKVIAMLASKVTEGQMSFGDLGGGFNPIQVSIGQFYGIEINDFAVTVAKTALWIAESQMMKETEEIVHMKLEFLPLRSYANIIEANALRVDWEDVISKHEVNYIMGNPPFIGMKEQTEANKEDMRLVIPIKKLKQLDYVAAWYFKSAEFIYGTKIECAFVSSNSITQGEQALTIWEPLFKMGVIINFAHRTFIWDSEATIKAHVHCVIIGFSLVGRKEKKLYDNSSLKKCSNINHYLTTGENVFIEKQSRPLCKVPEMTKGAQLIDDGHFIIGNKDDYLEVLQKEPNIKPYIRKYLNGRALLNGEEPKYVLYLEECPPNVLKSSKLISERVRAVYEFRANNESPSTNVLKDRPSHYFQAQAPAGTSIVFSAISSGNRRYVPMDFLSEIMVLPNTIFFIDNADIYLFGILMSNVHMAWMRTNCGRLKSDYRYSNTMVYNTFPFPKATDEQRERIKQTAQAILDARKLYPDSTLAEMYDEVYMPPELRKAHQENDKAVMSAYGFKKVDAETGKTRWLNEAETIGELMNMYQELVSQKKSKKR